MNIKKITALVLACLMIACVFVSCGKKDDGDNNKESDGQQQELKFTVSIKVVDFEGKTVYDAPEYVYTGKAAPNLIELIDDYMYMEHDDAKVEYDEFGDIVSIGPAKSGTMFTDKDSEEVNTYWWYKVNGKDGSKSLSEYAISNGDKIIYEVRQSKVKA